jgi:phage-related holin
MSLKLFLEKLTNLDPDIWEYITYLTYAAFAYLSLDIDIVRILMWLMIIDTFFGAIKAVRVAKIKFSLKTMLWGILTKATILTIPMILALVALGLGYDFIWLIDIVIKILVLHEGISIITNMISIRQNKNIINADIISVMLLKIREVFTDLVKKLTGDISKDEEK